MPDTEIAEAYGGVVGGVENGVENGSAGKQLPVVPITYKAVKPHLIFQAPKGAEAISFYKKAFGAEELHKAFCPKRKAEQEQLLIMHAHLRFGGTDVYLADEPEDTTRNTTVKSPATLNGTTLVLHLDTNDVEAAVARAVEAGGTVGIKVADQFWGERYGTVVDPFGYVWGFSTPLLKEAVAIPELPIEAGQAA